MLLESCTDLAAGVAELHDDEPAAALGCARHVTEGVETRTAEGCVPRNDRVAGRLEVLVRYHSVADQDGSEAALAPSPVDVDQFGGGDTARGQVSGGPA